jgi:mannose-6-phosphate isomerase-like protein (cupin superfamily)
MNNNGIYIKNIEKDTIDNKYYRNVVGTCSSDGLQVVLMSLKPNEEIGREKHMNTDQFIRIEKGQGIAIINDKKEYELRDGSVIMIPKGIYHNIINTGKTELKLYTIYNHAQHKDGIIETTKEMEEITSDDTDTSESSDVEQIIRMEESERMESYNNEQTGGKMRIYRLKKMK